MGLRNLTRLRVGVAVALCGVTGTACSSTPPAEARPPDAFGWVVSWEQSPDYQYQPAGRGAVTAGSAAFTLEDGTRFTVLPSTDLEGSTCEALPATDLGYGPCWVHVGLSADRTTALWLTTFWAQGWAPAESGTVPVADRVLINRDFDREEAGQLVLTDGTVLPFDRSRVEVVCEDGSTTIDEVLDRAGSEGRLYVVADQQTGVVTQLDCHPVD
jgi:hypothetical protein